MTTPSADPNLAVFCDYENVALGARDDRYEFDIQLVLARVLDKGKIIVKKAYADWDRYRSAKRPMHEAAFELIEIPHLRISGKNSADIRMVVDALDLCYTKPHLDGFVLISGDSDFSPLVSKLRENDKLVIGVGVKNSTSDLLVENCDEFIYYNDLVRAKQGRSSRSSGGRRKKPRESREGRDAKDTKETKAAKEDASGKNGKAAAPAKAEKLGAPEEAFELILETVESLFADRDGNLHASMVKQVLKRKRPNFSEGYYGFRTFNALIVEIGERGLLELQKDERSGGYVISGFGPEA